MSKKQVNPSRRNPYVESARKRKAGPMRDKREKIRKKIEDGELEDVESKVSEV